VAAVRDDSADGGVHVTVVAWVFLLGFVGFGTNPTLNARAFGLVDGAGTGYASTAWIGAGLGVAALAAVALGGRVRPVRERGKTAVKV
jgi:DHA1 family chloramphenicol resistance protein-like MFS transporter